MTYSLFLFGDVELVHLPTPLLAGVCSSHSSDSKSFGKRMFQCVMIDWLVAWNIWIIFPDIGNNHSN